MAAAAVGSTLVWVAASSAIVVVNKTLIVDVGFGYPMALTALGLACSGLLSVLVCASGVVRRTQRPSARFVLLEACPVALAGAAAMGLGNHAYFTLSMAFIQILKAFTPAATFLTCWAMGLERLTAGLTGAVAAIVAGTAVATAAEHHSERGRFHPEGFTFFMVSVLFEALRVVLIQRLMGGQRRKPMHPLEGLQYTAVPSAAFMAAGSAVWELEGLRRDGLATMAEHPGLFALASLLGLAVNLATLSAIQHTSSLTLKVVGCAKNALIVYVGALQGDHVSPMQVVGYGMSLAGFGAYSWFKAREEAPPAAKTKAA